MLQVNPIFFQGNTCKHNRKTQQQGNTIIFIGKKLQKILKFPTTVFPYYVYKFSLKRLWGSPITFTILPIPIKDFPYNLIVVSPLQCFPIIFISMECTFPVNPCKRLQCSGIVHVGNCLERWCKIPTEQKKQLFFQPKKGKKSYTYLQEIVKSK